MSVEFFSLSFAILNTFFCPSVVSMSAYRRSYVLALAIATLFFCFLLCCFICSFFLHYYLCQGLSWPVSLFGCFPGHPRSTTRSHFPASYFQMFSLAISRLVVSDPQSLSPSPAFLPRLSAVLYFLPLLYTDPWGLVLLFSIMLSWALLSADFSIIV